MIIKGRCFRRILQVIICSLVIVCVSTSCSEENMSQVKENMAKKKEEIASNVQKEIKDAILSQIQDFFQDTDFMEAFGMSDEDKEKVEQQMEELVENYEFDVSNLKDVQEQLDSLFDANAIAKQQEQDNERIKQVLEEIKKKITESNKSTRGNLHGNESR